eukprot:2720438-Prymnesium_polylepis.1
MLFSITTARGAVASLSITRLRRRSRPPPHKYLIYVLHLPKPKTYETRFSPLVCTLQQLQDQQVPAARVGRPLVSYCYGRHRTCSARGSAAACLSLVVSRIPFSKGAGVEPRRAWLSTVSQRDQLPTTITGIQSGCKTGSIPSLWRLRGPRLQPREAAVRFS